jgi:hypothetical protein
LAENPNDISASTFFQMIRYSNPSCHHQWEMQHAFQALANTVFRIDLLPQRHG